MYVEVLATICFTVTFANVDLEQLELNGQQNIIKKFHQATVALCL